MKKNLIMLCGWMAMTFAACTNDDLPIVIEQPNQAGEEVLVTAYAAGDDTPDSRISSTYDDANQKYTFTWDNDDTFSVIRDGVNETFTKTNGGENEFLGDKPGSTGDFYAIYPQTTATDHTKATFDISTQTNNATYVMYATSADGDVYHFKHAMSFLRFTLPEGLDDTTFDITITTPTGVFTTGIINLTDGSISYDGSIKNTISLEDRTAAGAILVAIPPMPAGSNKRLSFWVKSDSGKYYEGTLSGNSEKPIEAGKYYTASLSLTETDIPYLTFTAQGEQTFTMNTEFEYRLPESLEYSVNNGEWIPVNTIVDPISFGGANGNLRLRGNSLTGTAENDMNYSWIEFGNDTPVACTGDIRTLVDWEDYKNAVTSDARFCYLFNGCSALTTAPALPATTLKKYCYYQMFSGCTSLTAAPALPAETLADNCYAFMFFGCTSLATAPTLPATTLAEGCYQSMFYRCKALATAPALPVTTLARYCYYQMFRECTSLTTAPTLPAETLANYCYQSMFRGCTSLATAPATLPATTLANNCYNFMFQGCSELTTAPALPATTLAVNCYSGMFIDCTNLTAAPTLPATNLAENCYYSMFNNCTSLETAPALPATTLAPFCYNYMFKNCTSLTAAPATLPATTLANNCYDQMFYGCNKLTTAPVLPATTLANNCYSDMFYGCSMLNSITMLATDISANNCLRNWVNGVAASGTFYKNSAATWNVTGTNGVPSGWDVEIVTP